MVEPLEGCLLIEIPSTITGRSLLFSAVGGDHFSRLARSHQDLEVVVERFKNHKVQLDQ